MPPSPNSYKLPKLLITNSKWGLFRGLHVTIFVNYFNVFHTFLGGNTGKNADRGGLKKWNNGMVE
jgi:hypothetical protein